MSEIVTQARFEAGWQIGVDHRAERAIYAAGDEDSVLLGDVAAVGIDRVNGGATERRRARDAGEGRGGRIDLHQIERAGLERETAGDRHRGTRRAVASGERAATIDRGVADNAGAGERAAVVHRGS